MTKLLSFAGFLALTATAFGDMVNQTGTVVDSASGFTENVQLLMPEEGGLDTTLNITGKPTIRKKAGDRYHIASYATPGTKLTLKGRVKEIATVKDKVIHIKIISTLKKADLIGSFKDSLDANSVSYVKGTQVRKLLDAIEFDVNPGDVIDFMSHTRADGTDNVRVALTRKGETKPSVLLDKTSAEKDLGRKFWVIWLGKSADTFIGNMSEVTKDLVGE